MQAVAGKHAPGRGEGVERLRGWLWYTITYLSSKMLSCGCKGEIQRKWWKNWRHTCSGKGRRNGPIIRVEYRDPLAAWIFPRQGTRCGYHSANLVAVFPNYGILYLVLFLCFVTLSWAIFAAWNRQRQCLGSLKQFVFGLHDDSLNLSLPGSYQFSPNIMTICILIFSTTCFLWYGT